jgi:hypothetical protein
MKEGIIIKLSETSEMMNSKDFKERFRAEYFQLQNRIEGLSSMLDKYRKGTLPFTPKCSIKILDGQMAAMLSYKTHLVERARIEGISLEEVVIIETSESDNQAAEK